MNNDHIEYCQSQVRLHDPDRYLLSMFAPADRRAALWALFAFNQEIAKTREVVTETQLGLIRLQWWRDAIEGIYERGEVLEHAVLEALAAAIKAYDLPREHFDTLIYAREFDLEDVLPGNVEGLLNYADFTNTPLLKLGVQIAGGEPESEPVQAVGINYGLSGVLRAVPFHAQQRRCYLPEDEIQKHGQSINKLYDYKRVEDFPRIVEAAANAFVNGVRPDNKFLRKAQKLAVIYQKQLRGAGYDPFHEKMRGEPIFKVFRLVF